MKAVIVEIKGEYASALSDDGSFSKIKNHGYEPGQVIQLTMTKVNVVKRLTMLAASAAAVLILGIGTWAYASPYSYVSLDVNPSIEYIVNRFDRVLRVNAVNDDGEEILKEINLKELRNRSIQDALARTVEQFQESGYFSGQEAGGIVIATSAQNPEKAEELAVELQSTIQEEIVEQKDNVTVETFSVPKERVEKARELGVTPGKLNLVEKLQVSASDEDNIDLEEWLNKPVKDIMKATNSYTSGSAATEIEEPVLATEAEDQRPGGKDKAGKHPNKKYKEEIIPAKPDKHSDIGKEQPSHGPGKETDGPDKGPGNGKDGPGKGTGNAKDLPAHSPGNDKDGTDKGPGNAKDLPAHSPGNDKDGTDKGPGNAKDGTDKSPGNAKDGADKGPGNAKNRPDHSPNNDKDGPDHGPGNGKKGPAKGSGDSHNKPDKATGQGSNKSDKGPTAPQKK